MSNGAPACVISHVGICVSSLERSRKFYEEVFGFEFFDEGDAPDEVTSILGDLKPPIGCKAAFFKKGNFTLELLYFAHLGANSPPRPRVMNDLGLTHISIGVEDMEATVRKVAEYGGTPLDHTRLPDAMLVRDPDGQVLELIPRSYAERTRPS